ncbi:hypothetical protein [Inconstantimicrobium mannanitabidum]|uniref:Uncharacterized protein n=1 Tax=Inconstantimicrobium mannanitabidum TaxID=1604901 RepID=A0ACB5RCJ8_9CLOT|nr:hypothetical protein [Clostridium sp. TW13]GKX66997.1 hypothetical protein rsdtw13_22550 [Clostridium sp. TW13]
MCDWKKLKIDGIASIEKCVAEFDIMEFIKTPYGKFKVKIYEKQNGKFCGYTNLKIRDEDGCHFGAVGYGNTIEDALKDTIKDFKSMLEEKDIWHEAMTIRQLKNN